MSKKNGTRVVIEVQGDGRLELPVERVWPNPEQPRKVFDAVELDDLAQSIRRNGVIQPIVVEQVGESFILHDGERRLRAARLAGLKTIPAVLAAPEASGSQEERLFRALVANIQRADLGPIEEGESFKRLINMGYSRVEISLRLGVSVARVSMRLDLLDLDQPIQKLIGEGRLPKDARLTKALLDIPDARARVRMAETLAERNVDIKSGVVACQRLVESLAEKRVMGKNEIPGVGLASCKVGEVNRPIWDAFAQVGRVPPWLLVEIAARDVCDQCTLREQASSTTCRGCALVEMLAHLIGSTRK